LASKGNVRNLGLRENRACNQRAHLKLFIAIDGGFWDKMGREVGGLKQFGIILTNRGQIHKLGLRFSEIVEQPIEASFDAIDLNSLAVYGQNLLGNQSISSISMDCDGGWWMVH